MPAWLDKSTMKGSIFVSVSDLAWLFEDCSISCSGCIKLIYLRGRMLLGVSSEMLQEMLQIDG